MIAGTALVLALLSLLLGVGLATRLVELERLVRSLQPTDLSRRGLQPGAPVPDLRLTSLDGSPIDWSGAAHGPTLIAFTNTGCEACRAFETSLPQFQREHPDWRVLVIAQGERDAVRQRFVGAGLPPDSIVHQQNFEFADAFDTKVTPHTFAVRNGRVAAQVISGKWSDLAELATIAGH